MSRELSPAEQQQLFELLLRELHRARESALADGVAPAAFDDLIDERQRALASEDDGDAG